MKQYISTFFKGLGMGAANVILGVSGGTIALITGIFERIINAIKSFDVQALKLLY
jgi:putative membrane protein